MIDTKNKTLLMIKEKIKKRGFSSYIEPIDDASIYEINSTEQTNDDFEEPKLNLKELM